MILLKFLTAALLTTILVLGLATQSHGNENSNGTGGGIGGTGISQINSNRMVNMSNSGELSCDGKLSIGTIAIAQGPSVKYKSGELLCEGVDLNIQKNEYVVVELQNRIKVLIAGPAELLFQSNKDAANGQKYVLKLLIGRVRVTRSEMGPDPMLIQTTNSTIELSGFDAEVILKPTSDGKHSTYVRSYSGASWLSLGSKKVAIPMGYMGFSNEDIGNPIVEVKKDAGELGSRTPGSPL